MSTVVPTWAALDVLLSLTTSLGGATTESGIYESALDAIERGFRVRRAAILLFDSDGVMRFKAWRNLSDGYRRGVEGHTPWTPDARDAEPIVVADVSTDQALASYLPQLRAEGIASLTFVPLVAGGRVIGKFMLSYGEARREHPELSLARVIAAQVAFAVQRVRAEVAATQAEQHLRAVVDSTPECVKTVAADGSLPEMNAAGLHMIDAPDAAAVVGRSVYDLIAPEDRAAYRAFNERVCAGQAGTLEFDIIGFAGTRRTVETHAVPLPDSDGSFRQLGVTRDITRRRKAEAALADSEAMFRQIANSLPQIIWITSAEGVPQYFNARWYEFTGLPPGSFDRDAWRARIHPDDRQATLDLWARNFAAGEPFECELRLREGRTGAYRWHLARSVPIRRDDGTVLRWIGSSTNIDEQKRAERTSRFIAEASRAMSTLVDVQTALQRIAELAVPDFADWCAVDMADGRGKLRRLALCHPDASKVELAFELEQRFPPRADAPQGAHNVLRTGVPEMMSDIPDALLEHAAHDAEHLAAIRALGLRSYIAVPLVAAGRPVGVISFATADDSGRRYDTHDLDIARELAYRAGIAVENASLYEDLKSAARQKDEFLAVLAHELRNPLAPIRTALELLHIGDHDAAKRTRLYNVMNRQLRHLVRLVDDLLDVSRITRGLIELQKRRIELSEVIRSAVETSRPVIEASAHTLTVSYAATPLAVEGDAMRLAQAFSNVLNNAAKYTPKGGHITVTLESSGTTAMVRVRDSGIGIPREMLPHIFDMFVQVDRSFERTGGGLGIGLTLAKRLVEMHGGSITALSDGPGTGSEFVVSLPMADMGASVESPETDASTALPVGVGRRILIADDNDDAAECLADALRVIGHDVRTAHDGADAIEIATTYRPHLVLLDLGMPRVDGYSAAKGIRDCLGDAVLIVAVTGWGQSADQQRSHAAGFDRHWIKPVEFADVAVLASTLRDTEVDGGET